MTTYRGLHETLEAHELLVFKNLSLTKSLAMRLLAQDEELKQLLSAEVQSGEKFVQDLQQVLTEGSYQS